MKATVSRWSGLALLTALLMTGYVHSQGRDRVYSSAREISPVLTGTKAPDVSFTTLEGEKLSLQAALSEKPALLIFYRGGW